MGRKISLISKVRSIFSNNGQKLILWSVAILSILLFASWNVLFVPKSEDIGLYFHYARQFFDGLVPFRDYTIEYPPGAFYLFAIPAILVTSLETYKITFTLLPIPFIFYGGYVIHRLTKSWKAVFLALIALLLMPAEMVFQRFDVIVGVLTLASLYTFQRKQWLPSYILLGIATIMKFYPVILLPFYIVLTPFIREKLKYVGVYLGSLLVFCLPFFLQQTNFQQISFFWSYNQDRGIQLESTWSSLLITDHFLFGTPLHVSTDHGAKNVESPASALLATLSEIVTTLLLILLFLLYYGMALHSSKNIIGISFLAIGAFILGNKVFSPQYLLWLIPLFPLFIRSFASLHGRILGMGFLAVILLTHLIFPTFYIRLIHLETLPTILLIFRNMFLLALVLYGAILFFRRNKKCKMVSSHHEVV